MKQLSIIVIYISLLAQACQQNTKKIATNNSHQHHHEETTEIELNHGKKWFVDSAMMIIIKHMNQQVNDFKGKSVPEYQVLSDSLLTNINLLTSSCTMQVKAHDELHKWLVPFITLVGDFSEVKSSDEGKKYFSKIVAEFNRFQIYFE